MVIIGVILTLGISLALVQAFFELYVVFAFRPEKYKDEDHHPLSRPIFKFMHKLGPWVERSSFNSLVFSFLLSLFIGVFYPAAGAAMLIGGIGSTVMTEPVYAVRRQVAKLKEQRRKNPAAIEAASTLLGTTIRLPDGRVVANPMHHLRRPAEAEVIDIPIQ